MLKVQQEKFELLHFKISLSDDSGNPASYLPSSSEYYGLDDDELAKVLDCNEEEDDCAGFNFSFLI